MGVRSDVRLLDVPMVAVDCGACAARVEVRKASWEQTTVQWGTAAAQACFERRGASPRPGPNGAAFSGCGELRASIREAALAGGIRIASEQQHDRMS